MAELSDILGSLLYGGVQRNPNYNPTDPGTVGNDVPLDDQGNPLNKNGSVMSDDDIAANVQAASTPYRQPGRFETALAPATAAYETAQNNQGFNIANTANYENQAAKDVNTSRVNDFTNAPSQAAKLAATGLLQRGTSLLSGGIGDPNDAMLAANNYDAGIATPQSQAAVNAASLAAHVTARPLENFASLDDTYNAEIANANDRAYGDMAASGLRRSLLNNNLGIDLAAGNAAHAANYSQSQTEATNSDVRNKVATGSAANNTITGLNQAKTGAIGSGTAVSQAEYNDAAEKMRETNETYGLRYHDLGNGYAIDMLLHTKIPSASMSYQQRMLMDSQPKRMATIKMPDGSTRQIPWSDPIDLSLDGSGAPKQITQRTPVAAIRKPMVSLPSNEVAGVGPSLWQGIKNLPSDVISLGAGARIADQNFRSHLIGGTIQPSYTLNNVAAPTPIELVKRKLELGRPLNEAEQILATQNNLK